MNPLGTDAPGVGGVPDVRLVPAAVGTWLCAALLLGFPSRVAFVTAGGLALAAGLVGSVALRRGSGGVDRGAATVPVAAPASRGVSASRGAATSPWAPGAAHGPVRRVSGGAWVAPVLAVLVCSAAGALVVGGRLAGVESGPVAVLAKRETTATMRVVVTGDPRPRTGPRQPGRPEFVIDARTEWVTVDGRRVHSRVPVVLLASGDRWQAMLPGQPARLTGRVVPSGEGGLVRGLVLVRGPPRTDPPPAASAWAGAARARLREVASVLPDPARGLLPAVVVGDVTHLDPVTAEEFRDTGMTHLLTVSGANLAVLTGVALGLGRWFRWPGWVTAAGGAVMIAVFVLVARPEPSVLRAACMGGTALLALALGRRRAGIAALAATVIGLVLFSPGLARSYGFTLSVLATAGIMVLAPGWRDRWSRWVPRWAAEAVAVALAAHLACAPVLVLLSAEVSWVAVPANAVTTPVMPIATVGGFVVAGLALVWPDAAAVLVWVPGVVVLWVGAVASFGADVPQGAVPWRDDLTGALALTLLIAVVVALRGRARRVVLAAGVAVAVSATAVHCAAPSWPPARWAVTACDVGQGDAIALSSGRGRAVLVDTGADPRAVDRCLADLGVRAIALLVLTHSDTDHVGGTAGALADRAVWAALVPSGFDAPATERALAGARVPVRTARVGQRWSDGPWRLDVLWPRPGAPSESDNDASVVLLARWEPPRGRSGAPMSVLLTGDIEEPAQRALLGSAAIRDVDVLKTPHHGASTQEPAFIAATRPRVTLTSVGADNRYGHPAPRTRRLLSSLGAATYRTDRHGDIAVLPGPDGPSVVPRGPSASRTG